MPRDRFQKQSLGVQLRVIKESRVLLVGAGGIGCELLKNLVLSSFGAIDIIDLDTIDLSNLNRQFLFRHEHIKKAKAIVAKEVAQRFNPNVQLTAHVANIKDPQFNLEWFAGFTLVFNALDNLDARRHVNKMCLAADVPLIESGTTGFNGQVQVIKKGRTACYDCSPKTVPKSFPVCTIRSTPSQPIHCIVWAKSYLLPELFGPSEESAPEVDTSEDAANSEEIETLRREAQALTRIRETMGSDDFAKNVFEKVFHEDVDRLRKMEDMWKSRKAPEVLSYDTLSTESAHHHPSIAQSDQNIWTRSENFTVFQDSLTRLSKRLLDEQAAALKSPAELPKPIITFDKDDADTLDFVAAASNLRSMVFGIEPKSKFDVKQMAGNIIPAIATTNAMIAGLCVLQAFKVLKDDYRRAKMIFLERGNMQAGPVDPPNPDCVVCSVAMTRIHFDSSRATLADLVHGILKEQLEYSDEITVMNDKGPIFDPEMDDNLDKQLCHLGVTDGSFLLVQDDTEEEPRVDLQLAMCRTEIPEESSAVLLPSKPEIGKKLPKQPAATDEPTGDKEPNGNATGDVNVNGVTDKTHDMVIGKRKRLADDGEDLPVLGTPSKKALTKMNVDVNGEERVNGNGSTNGNGNESVTAVNDEADEGAIDLTAD